MEITEYLPYVIILILGIDWARVRLQLRTLRTVIDSVDNLVNSEETTQDTYVLAQSMRDLLPKK